MDPMSRKMFKSRDARNTLRGMGGIMASSPELSQTVQQFQEGGRVTGLDQMELDNVSTARATRIGGKTYLMLPSGVVLDAQTRAPVSGEETLSVQRKLNAFPGRDPVLSEENLAMRVNPSFATDTRDRSFGVGVSDRGLSAPSVGSAPPMPTSISPAPSDLSFLRTAPQMPGDADADNAAFQRMSVEEALSRRPGIRLSGSPDISEMSPARLEAERMAAESGGLGEFATDIAEGVTGAVRGAGESLQRGLGSGLSSMGMPGAGAFFLEGAEDTAAISARRAQEERGREAARADRIAEIDEAAGVTRGEPLTVPKGGAAALLPPAPADETVETTVTEGETPVLTPTADTGAGTAAPEIDFDASYAQAKERLGAIMGGEADDDKKNKAMANLAMIGLAIASGQSPNALTNIAQGALAGMQGISKAEAAEKAQEREIELAATKMAADEVDLNKRLASAEKIAAMRTAGGSGTFSPQDRLYNSVFTEMLQQTGDVEEASAAARQAAPGASQAAMSAVAGAGPSAGQIVEQNGIRYQRQADGSFKQLG